MFSITEPTLLLDEHKVRANIANMAKKAQANNLTLKPHVKTHQSIQIGTWMKEAGIRQITVSSITMAEYFAASGWKDITIAFPCNILVLDRINKLAAEVNLCILISDPKTFLHLNEFLKNKVQVYIEIDTGSHRTGLPAGQLTEIKALAGGISESPFMHFRGFYSHPGHSYAARSRQEIETVHKSSINHMQRLKSHFIDDFPNLVCCLGDTPCCSVGETWNGIDEISPGNFVFYDVMQTAIGSCTAKDIAVALVCPVVAKYPERNEIAVHGGAVHLSKDSLTKNGDQNFGHIVAINDELQWSAPVENCYVKSVSQEHGIITCSPSFFDSIEIGTCIGILPIHSCLTADTMKAYITNKSFEAIDHMQAST